MDSLDEDELLEAMASIDVLIGELIKSPKDVWNSITASYSDLYLNRCYILAMRARIPKVCRSCGTSCFSTSCFLSSLLGVLVLWSVVSTALLQPAFRQR